MISARRGLSIARRSARSLAGHLRERLLPAICLLCGDRGLPGLDLCAGCLAELPRPAAGCTVCAAALQVSAVCGHCQQRPPPYRHTVAAFRYGWPVDHMITALKFHGRLVMARVLGDLMATALASEGAPWPQRLIPVPLHSTRLRARGFNQAVELARPIACRLGIPIDLHSCSRIRATAAQSSIPADQRRRNVRGAFRAHKPLQGHVAIVDDVMTTGHTVEALARCTARSGTAQSHS
jgi:ComF family protein